MFVFPSGETTARVLYLLLLNVCVKLRTEVTSIQAALKETTAIIICVGSFD